MSKIGKRIINRLLLFTMIFSFLLSNGMSISSYINNIQPQTAGITASGKSLQTENIFNISTTNKIHYGFDSGNKTWEMGFFKFTLNGKTVFCIEPFIWFVGGDWYNPNPHTGGSVPLRRTTNRTNFSNFSADQIARLARIVYYGYKTQPSNVNYYYTQLMVWEFVEGSNINSISSPPPGTSLAGLRRFRSDVHSKVNASYQPQRTYRTGGSPSWSGGVQRIQPQHLGRSITLRDSNNVAQNLNQPSGSPSGGITWTKSGNTWTANIPRNLNDGVYNFSFSGQSTQRVGSGRTVDPGTTIIWVPSNGNQKMGEMYASFTPIEERTTTYRANYSLQKLGQFDATPIFVKVNEAGRPLSGATFRVQGYNGLGTRVLNYTTQTNARGEIRLESMSSNAGNGYFLIQETQAPNGYDRDTKEYRINLDGNGNIISSSVPKIKNTPTTGEIKIEKKAFDGTNTTPGRGFVFDLINKSTGHTVKTLTTNEGGQASSGQIELGTYIIRERPTNGYKTLPDKEVQITPTARSITYTATNEATTRELQILKKDQATGETIAYEGVEFDIINKSSGQSVGRIKTDRNGVAKTGQIPFGNYEAREVRAPHGYILSDQPQPFEITENTPARKVIEFNNVKQTGSLTVNKTADQVVEWSQDEQGIYKPNFQNRPLQGVKFNIKDDQGINYGEIETNDQGVAQIGNLPVDRTYTITEVEAPNNFVKSAPVQVRIDYAGQNVNVAQGTGNVHNKHKFTNISIDKQFEDYVGDKYAKIGLYTATENRGLPEDALVGVAELTGNGRATISNLAIDGEFYFKEIEVNSAYKLNENKYPVTISFGSGNDQQVSAHAGTMINELTSTSLGLVKYERGSNKEIPVAGAIFELINVTEDKVMGRFTTDNQGRIEVDNLRPAEYRWKEVQAPVGYFLNEATVDARTQPGVTDRVWVETDNERIPTIGTTAAFDNLGKLDNPTNTLTIFDDVEYKDLVPGVEYTLSGALMHQETGLSLKDVNGEEIRSTVKFVPETRDGVQRVQFTVDRDSVKRMRGQHITVFEWLTRGDGIELTEHTDIEDAGQTVRVTDPKIRTEAFWYDDSKEYEPIDSVILKDIVHYEDVLPGVPYKLTGQIMVKSTGEPLLQSGQPVITEHTFTPENASGSTTLEFNIQANQLYGEDIVVYETLTYEDDWMAEHKDIDDALQTVHITDPSIGTTAFFEDNGKVHNPNTTVKIYDDVEFKDLIPGKEYELEGTLMLKGSEQPLLQNGRPVTVRESFTPEARSGVYRMVFEIDASLVRGEEIVVYETLYSHGQEIYVHHDINDTAQTVKITDPEIGTTATFQDPIDQKKHEPLSLVKVYDSVEYNDVVPGKEYTMSGRLMHKDTGEVVQNSDGPVEANVTFTPEQSHGFVTVVFDVEARNLRGQSVVAFEQLINNGDVLAIHEDLTDVGQTVDFTDPKIGTTAYFEDGKKIHEALEDVTIYDTVEYQNLIPGKEYTMTGDVRLKRTGEPLRDRDGEIITQSTTFIPEAPVGSVVLSFTVPAVALRGEEVVAFETLYYKGEDIAIHHDIEDEAQTVRFVDPKVWTQARFLDDLQVGDPLEDIPFYDNVYYEDVVDGRTYVVKGTVYDKSTGEPFVYVDGDEERTIEAINTFETTSTEGVHRMKFDVSLGDLRDQLRDKELVVYQQLFYQEEQIAEHEDIEDVEQTLRFTNPEIKTTATFDDRTKLTEPREKVLVHDDVEYHDLIPGKEYTMTGQLMVQETGDVLIQDGEPVEITTTFVPEKPDGVVRLTFEVDARNLRRQTLVAFEELKRDGQRLAIHHDIEDEQQSVEFTDPKVKTEAFWYDDSKEYEPIDSVELKDIVYYEDLIPGHPYKLTGQIMVKSTGEPLLQDGEPVITELDFTPEETSGHETLTFDIQANHLYGEDIVVYETLTYEGEWMAEHKDIDDALQTVHITDPSIGTTAFFEDKGKVHNPNTTVKIYDDVAFNELIPGKEYELEGTLMLKGSNKPLLQNGEPITIREKFVPETRSGIYRMVFEIDASLVRGEEIVVFETLYSHGQEIYVHHDIEDTEQTVRITNPEIGTTATFQDDIDQKKHEPLSLVKVYDHVEFKDVVPGKEYTMSGRLMHKDTGKVVENSDGPVEASVTFTPEQSHGFVTIVFDVEARNLRGQSVVVFEQLINNGDIIAVHEDINDVGQTVDFTDPNIGTTAVFQDGQKVHEPLEDVVIYDTVEYQNLIPGKEYTMTGDIRLKSTGEPLKDRSGNVITETTTFVPEAPVGSVVLAFTVPAAMLRGEEVVAFETLYFEGEDIAIHHDIHDESQTVRFTDPEIGTQAQFLDELSLSDPLSETPLTDDVTYKDVIPGRTYTLRGILMDKSTGQPFVYTDANGEQHPLTAVDTFIPTETEGTYTITFDVKLGDLREQLRGRELVVYEELVYENEVIAEHKDIEDEGQTVRFTNPGIGTTAVFEGDTKENDPLSTVIIHDDVEYKGLIPGKTYQMTGQLMRQSTGEVLLQDGKPVEQTVDFTPEKSDGVIRLTFEMDATLLRGETVVAFEELHRNGDRLAIHHDIEDEEQSVHFSDPKIGTTAVFDDGSKLGDAIEKVTIIDTVAYENVITGHEYHLKGRLMSKSTGKAFLVNGEPVDSELTFTPEERSGTVDMTFTFDARALQGQQLVVFEVMTREGEVVATHEDMSDEGQTVAFTEPKIGTTATFDGKDQKVSEPLEEVTVYDLVEYQGLIPGKTYTMSGVLMDKATGEPFKQDGKAVASSVEFTPEAANGSVMIEFTVKAKDLAHKELVAFETLTREGVELAIHHDIEDEKQTVIFTGPEIGTQAVFQDGSKVADPVGELTVIDTVSYKGIVPGHTYKMVGQLMRKSTGGPATDPVELEFEAKEAEGTVKLSFTIHAEDLRGEEVVAFEKLYRRNEVIANHEDINDEGQTVRITGPNIGTKASFDQKDQKIEDPLETVTVYDEVVYRDLIPGQTYTMRGQFINKETGNPVGPEETLEFTPEAATGSVILEFQIPAKELAGQSIVAFEYLYQDGKEIAVHTNIEDEAQTVHFRNPQIQTSASFLDGSKEQEVSNQATIVDVVTYEGLTPGRTYTLNGQMVKKSDQSVVSEAASTFTPEAENGTTELRFTVDASNFKDGEEIVAFEEVFYQNDLLAEHKDINDTAQTVKFKVIPDIKPEKKPEKKPDQKPRQINPAGQFLSTPYGKAIAAVGLLLFVGLIVVLVIHFKKRQED